MSWIRLPLSIGLRLSARPLMALGHDPVQLRRVFEMSSRAVQPPLGSRFTSQTIGGVPGLWVRRGDAQTEDSTALLYFHGGGYFMGSPRTHRAMLAHLAGHSGLPVFLPEYRLAPEHLFPAAFEDAVAVYTALSATHRVVLGGDSAGGGLMLALLAEICRSGLPQPLRSFAFAPFTDFTLTGASHRDCARTEVFLPPSRVPELVAEYLNGADPTDPRVSPLFADFTGAAPVHLFASTSEILRDDTVRLVDRLKTQGVTVEATIEHGLPHVWPLLHSVLPEARETLAALGAELRAIPRAAGSQAQ